MSQDWPPCASVHLCIRPYSRNLTIFASSESLGSRGSHFDGLWPQCRMCDVMTSLSIERHIERHARLTRKATCGTARSHPVPPVHVSVDQPHTRRNSVPIALQQVRCVVYDGHGQVHSHPATNTLMVATGEQRDASQNFNSGHRTMPARASASASARGGGRMGVSVSVYQRDSDREVVLIVSSY